MAKKKLTPEQEKEIKMLRASNEMYERTKEEAMMRGEKDVIERLEFAQKDTKERIEILEGGDDKKDGKKPVEAKKAAGMDGGIYAILEKNRAENNPSPKQKSSVKVIEAYETEDEKADDGYASEIVNPSESMYNNVDPSVQYDVISLPSNGECYKDKVGKLPVGYLTAYDENIITSPNLYKDGMVIEYLLKNKVMNTDINVEDLITGDVDAIVLFLRATSYGTDFPVTVTDPISGEEIETSIDLSKIKTKKFTLKGDENGYFPYTLPKSKMEVKFRYLTRKDENDLKLLTKLENDAMVSMELSGASKTIYDILRADNVLEQKEKAVMLDFTRKLNDWANKVGERKSNSFNKMITNRLEMQIMSVNGNSDREYIRNFIYSMSAGDSLSLRKYIIANEPGMDFEVEIERPESLGGGSFKTFLEWNDTVFFNIS